MVSKMVIEYERAKEVYESIKPIRGRAGDIRPLGKRRRDFERVCKVGDNYTYRLHNTDCVIFEPTRTIIQCGEWPSVMTAKFLDEYTPLYTCKRHNTVWVSSLMTYGNVVPLVKPLVLERQSDGKYTYKPEPYLVRRVDRTAAKAARGVLAPFLQWMTMFLKMSDGVVTHDIINEARKTLSIPVLNGRLYGLPRDFVFRKLADTQWAINEEHFPVILACVMGAVRDLDTYPGGYRVPMEDVPLLKSALYRMHEKYSGLNIYRTEEVMPYSKTDPNIVIK